jgi:hypothetical protein
MNTLITLLLFPVMTTALSLNQYYSGSGILLNQCPISECSAYYTQHCLAGFYLDACGNDGNGNTALGSPGTCKACTPVANSVFVKTPGSPVYTATGCDFTCNAPLWKKVGTACVTTSCTAPSSGQNAELTTTNEPCEAKCKSGYSGTRAAPASIVCTICPAGTYRDMNEPGDSCLPCPQGTFSNSGAQSLASCTACTIGTYGDTTGVAACTDCGAGYYGKKTGGTSKSDGCDACPKGTWSAAVAPTSSSACQNCDAGKYSVTLAATVSTTCISCDAGTFSGAAGASACTNCLAGFYAASTGAIACTPCSVAGLTSGQYRADCGGISAGTVGSCTN